MDSFKYDLQLLDHLQSTLTSQAGQMGAVGDSVDAPPAESVFGSTAGSRALATAVTAAARHLRQEFSTAEKLLRDVATAVDRAQLAVEQADRDAAGALRQAADRRDAPAPSVAPASYSGGSPSGSAAPIVAADPDVGTAPPVLPGTGVTVNLPGGLPSVQAPNVEAATAVRAALTQLGTPYVWAAENPGVGFDCSGLTQWAYGRAGVPLEHFSGAQDVGERVSRANLAPGDLVVWDGHVAMYLGDGMIIEAPHTGAVVHIRPLYTHNGNDTFLGFYRPSVDR